MKKFSKLLILGTFVGLMFSSVFAGKLWLEPAQGEFTANCPFELKIMMDTEGVESNTVGVSFYIDDTVYALNPLDTVGGVFPAYTSFVRGKAWHGERKGDQTISIMGTTAQKKGIKGDGVFATIKILPLMGTNNLDLEFYAIPGFSADDSNINYTLDGDVLDALDEAIGGHYTFVPGSCGTGYEAPVVISETDPVVLTTAEEDVFFTHQMPFFPRIGRILITNINYVIIGILVILILFFLLKRRKDDDKDKKPSKN